MRSTCREVMNRGFCTARLDRCRCYCCGFCRCRCRWLRLHALAAIQSLREAVRYSSEWSSRRSGVKSRVYYSVTWSVYRQRASSRASTTDQGRYNCVLGLTMAWLERVLCASSGMARLTRVDGRHAVHTDMEIYVHSALALISDGVIQRGHGVPSSAISLILNPLQP